MQSCFQRATLAEAMDIIIAWMVVESVTPARGEGHATVFIY